MKTYVIAGVVVLLALIGAVVAKPEAAGGLAQVVGAFFEGAAKVSVPADTPALPDGGT